MSNPIRDALDNPQAAPGMAQPGDVGPELDRHDEYDAFPPGCPVRPLGNQQDIGGKQTCYYLNYNGQLVGLEAGNRHGKLALAALFGPQIGWLQANWPQWSKPKNEYDPAAKKWVQVEPPRIVGIDQAKAAEALVVECVRKGIFDPTSRMRGRGAHRTADGRGLVLHCGNALMLSDQRADGTIKGWHWTDPGLHDRHVYTAAEPIPRPWHERAGEDAAEKVLALLNTWNWKRGVLDARFALGAIGAGMIGGALRWRPHVWITGGRGTGKSSLNGEEGVVRRLFGEGLYRTDNASAAGIRSALRNSTVPVLFDEIEASADNRRVTEVVELARVASSGGKVTRGSQDHSAHEFTLQSCFWFSSINIPPLQAQDRSRLAILELRPFPAGAVPPDLSRVNFGDLGRQLLRRMIDGFTRLEPTKLKFHAALAAIGHDNRACDQFGMLLACADVLLWDHDTADGLPDDEEVARFVSMCAPQRMAEISEATPDHVACINHATTSMVQARGGDEREQLATWIGGALGAAMEPLFDPGEDKHGRRLQELGLKLVNAVYHPSRVDEAGKVIPARWGAMQFDKDLPGYLAVAGQHRALEQIYQGTTWQGGVWKQSLARHTVAGGAIEGVKVKFGKLSLTAVLVPLAAVLDETELPGASRPDKAAEWRGAQLADHGGGAG